MKRIFLVILCMLLIFAVAGCDMPATGEIVEFRDIRFVLPDAVSGVEEDGSYYISYEGVYEGKEVSYAAISIAYLEQNLGGSMAYFLGLEAQTMDELGEWSLISDDTIEVAGRQCAIRQGTFVEDNDDIPSSFISVFLPVDDDLRGDAYHFFLLIDDLGRLIVQEPGVELADPEADFFAILDTVEFMSFWQFLMALR